MNPLQKKCLVASAGTHSLLLLILVLGSAFFVAQPVTRPTQVLKVIPSILVDDAMAGGGGDPNVAPSDDKIKGDVPIPLPPPQAPPKKEPPKKEKELPKEPPAETTKKTREPAAADAEPKKSTKPSISLADLKPVSPSTRAQRDADKARAAQAAADRALADQLGQTAQSLRSGFAQGTAVQVHGTGGPAYGNYESLVRARYDDAWLIAENVGDENTTTKVSVTIARDGDVIDAKIIQRSGNAAFDRTVQQALERVQFVAPFPAGPKDNKRTFIINFNLRGRKLAG